MEEQRDRWIELKQIFYSKLRRMVEAEFAIKASTPSIFMVGWISALVVEGMLFQLL